MTVINTSFVIHVIPTRLGCLGVNTSFLTLHGQRLMHPTVSGNLTLPLLPQHLECKTVISEVLYSTLSLC